MQQALPAMAIPRQHPKKRKFDPAELDDNNGETETFASDAKCPTLPSTTTATTTSLSIENGNNRSNLLKSCAPSTSPSSIAKTATIYTTRTSQAESGALNNNCPLTSNDTNSGSVGSFTGRVAATCAESPEKRTIITR